MLCGGSGYTEAERERGGLGKGWGCHRGPLGPEGVSSRARMFSWNVTLFPHAFKLKNPQIKESLPFLPDKNKPLHGSVHIHGPAPYICRKQQITKRSLFLPMDPSHLRTLPQPDLLESLLPQKSFWGRSHFNSFSWPPGRGKTWWTNKILLVCWLQFSVSSISVQIA